MIDTIKKTLLAGIGATVVTKEKIEEALDDWIRQGKLSTSDAKLMATRIAEVGKREFETVSGELADKVKEAFAKVDLSHKARVDALEARVRALEEKLATPPPPPSRVSEP